MWKLQWQAEACPTLPNGQEAGPTWHGFASEKGRDAFLTCGRAGPGRLPIKWWRRGELNPRPRMPVMRRTTCVSGSLVFDLHFKAGESGEGLARLDLSRRGIETQDPSLDFINHCRCAGEHFARLLGGRLNGIAGIPKHPGVLAQVNDSVHKSFQTGIESDCLAA